MYCDTPFCVVQRHHMSLLTIFTKRQKPHSKPKWHGCHINVASAVVELSLALKLSWVRLVVAELSLALVVELS